MKFLQCNLITVKFYYLLHCFPLTFPGLSKSPLAVINFLKVFHWYDIVLFDSCVAIFKWCYHVFWNMVRIDGVFSLNLVSSATRIFEDLKFFRSLSVPTLLNIKLQNSKIPFGFLTILNSFWQVQWIFISTVLSFLY